MIIIFDCSIVQSAVIKSIYCFKCHLFNYCNNIWNLKIIVRAIFIKFYHNKSNIYFSILSLLHYLKFGCPNIFFNNSSENTEVI